jgi:hypothetical protein
MAEHAKRIYRAVASAILGLGLAQQAHAYQCSANIGCASCMTTCKADQMCCTTCGCSYCFCACRDGSNCS